jgi:hypothetical protein
MRTVAAVSVALRIRALVRGAIAATSLRTVDIDQARKSLSFWRPDKGRSASELRTVAVLYVTGAAQRWKKAKRLLPGTVTQDGDDEGFFGP